MTVVLLFLVMNTLVLRTRAQKLERSAVEQCNSAQGLKEQTAGAVAERKGVRGMFGKSHPCFSANCATTSTKASATFSAPLVSVRTLHLKSGHGTTKSF